MLASDNGLCFWKENYAIHHWSDDKLESCLVEMRTMMNTGLLYVVPMDMICCWERSNGSYIVDQPEKVHMLCCKRGLLSGCFVLEPVMMCIVLEKERLWNQKNCLQH